MHNKNWGGSWGEGHFPIEGSGNDQGFYNYIHWLLFVLLYINMSKGLF